MSGGSAEAPCSEPFALVKDLDKFNAQNYISHAVSDLSKYLLKVFLANGFHDLQTVESDIESSLMAPILVLNRETVRHKVYAIVQLHETARFFNAFPISDVIPNALSLTDRANRSLMSFFWVCAAYGNDKNKILEMVDAYKKIRTANPS